MPIDIEIDTERQQIRTRAHGVVTGEDLVAYYRRLRGHPDYHPAMSELWDATEALARDVSAEDMRLFSDFTEPHTRDGTPARVAIVVPDDLGFGLARMYQLMQTESVNRLRIVRSVEAAEAWLAEDLDRTDDPPDEDGPA